MNTSELIVPDQLAPYQPFSMANFEEELFNGLELVIQAGMTVFELGTYCGAMSTIIAQKVGSKGKVVVFEASPDALQRAGFLTGANHCENITFVQAFVGDKSAQQQPFYRIEEIEGQAVSTADAGIQALYPQAHQVLIPTLALDDYVRENNLAPDVIKIDIEGAEVLALRGLQQTLTRFAPSLVVEIHGDRLEGIGGSLEELKILLEKFTYRAIDLHTGEEMSCAEFLRNYPVFGHALFIPVAKIDAVTGKVHTNQAHLEQKENLLRLKSEAAGLANHLQYRQALALLQEVIANFPQEAEALYLMAFCYQGLDENLPLALENYQLALDHGFDEFWVRYNRGTLYKHLGRHSEALADLHRAVGLNPTHREARQVLAALLPVNRVSTGLKTNLKAFLRSLPGFKQLAYRLQSFQERLTRFEQRLDTLQTAENPTSRAQVDLVNFGDLSIFMYMDDWAYQNVPISLRNYSLQEHLAKIKAATQEPSAEIPTRLDKARLMPGLCRHCWENGVDFTYIDVGCQYGTTALQIGRFIQQNQHSNRVYAFDIGVARDLVEYNIRLNRLETQVFFEPIAITNHNLPSLVFSEAGRSENNRVINRDLKSESLSYVVRSSTIDRFIENQHIEGAIIIKIDTQGAEWEVWQGMQLTLKDRLVMALVEFTPHAIQNRLSPVDFLNLLAKNCVLFDVPVNEEPIREIPGPKFATYTEEINRRKEKYSDILALPKNLPQLERFCQCLQENQYFTTQKPQF